MTEKKKERKESKKDEQGQWDESQGEVYLLEGPWTEGPAP